MWSLVCGVGLRVGHRRPQAVPLLEDRRDHRHRDLGPVLVVAGDEDDVRARAVRARRLARRGTRRPITSEQERDEHASWLGDLGAAAGRTSMMPFIVRQWPGNVQTNG